MELGFKGLSNLSSVKQVLLVVVVCGALLAGFWYQFLSPIQTDIASKTAKMNELKAVVAKSEAQEKELQKIKLEAMDLQAKLDMLKMALPLEKETDQIFRAVQLQAGVSGLKVFRVAPKPTVDHEVYTEYPIDLEVTGTYHNVGMFLDKIRKLPRIVNVGGLRLTSKASEGELAFTSSVSAVYTATTFVYKDEPIASAALQPQTVK
jgi:type IV pilus assembly protein PilO